MNGVVHELVPNEWTEFHRNPQYPHGATLKYRCLNCGDTYGMRVAGPSCKMPEINEVNVIAEQIGAVTSDTLMPQALDQRLKKLKWVKWKRDWGIQLWRGWLRWQDRLKAQPWTGKTVDQLLAEEKQAK